MRDFLNSILAFIGSESLTDAEFDSIVGTYATYTKEAHDSLKAILEARESVSDQVDKLKYFFLAKGVDVSGSIATPHSNIMVGIAL